MPDKSNDPSRVSDPRLRQAFESLSKASGRSLVNLLIYDFERHGIALDKDGYYSLEQIRRVFEATFGDDGASLLIEKLRKELG